MISELVEALIYGAAWHVMKAPWGVYAPRRVQAAIEIVSTYKGPA